MEHGSDEMTKLTGIVDAVDLDEDDGVLAARVTTLDEDDYLVADGAVGEELLDLVGELVRVRGTVGENQDGDKVVTVREYLILDKDWDA